ncbi:hypothetical protein D7V93_30345 [Corallococcus llansteffanensis]|uniref:Uncharacterized protein n=1 Tax=Corallococcus llansteffanensis TaxID=2316731 RepID=A0A3A8PFU3_9BACT|nr:hypothetical protein D7V93_30345 [Corallococcus llansteffanensis]
MHAPSEEAAPGTRTAQAPTRPQAVEAREGPGPWWRGSEGGRFLMLTAGKRLAVFSIHEGKGGSIWVRAGSAFVNKDVMQ